MKELATKDGIDTTPRMLMAFSIAIVMLYMVDAILRTTSAQSMAVSASQYTGVQSYYNQPYFGALDPRVLSVSEVAGWIDLIHGSPYIPWIAADFFNDGPGTAFIAINYPTAYTELRNGESLQVSLVGAVRRIEVVFHKCGPGATASVRVVGKY